MKFNIALVAAAWVAAVPAFALQGQVVDSKGNAINGATVSIAGKRAAVATDAQGNFQIKLDSAAELHIVAPGYVHKTVQINSSALNTPQRIVLAASILEQIDVVGIVLHASSIESALPVNVLAGADLRRKQAATLGDSLAGEVGVHSSFYGNIASTPIIRGLSGPRVLITQNSLDVSDVSRVGSDHSVTTEVSTAEQLEVLRGPATLFFGGGAIGGVVNVVDKRVPTTTETTGEWLLSHDSVNDQNLASVNLNSGTGNIAFHFDGFWREANNYDVPVSPELDEDHGERTVASTAEESEGYTVGSSVILDNGYIGLSYGRLERDHGIPGHSHGHEEEGEQANEMVTLNLKQDRYQLLGELTFDHKLLSAFNTRIGYTDYSHTEFEAGFAGTTFTNETSEASFELLHQPLADWRGGLVLDIKNSKFAAVGEEAFTPPSKTDSIAIALLEERHFRDVLLQMGARVEQVSIKSNAVRIAAVEFHHHGEAEHEEHEEHEAEHAAETFSFDENYTPFSLSAGAVWEFTPGYNIGASLSYAERAPSAAELLAFGPHIASGTFEIGALFEAHEDDEAVHFERIANTPEMEKSTNLDLSFRKFEGNVGLILNAFYNKVDNYYAQFNTELFAETGHGHHEEEGDEDGHARELPVFLFKSADATLYGFEAQGVWQLNEQLKTTVFADYVRAELNNGGNLPRIPPRRVGASVDYAWNPISANLSWTHFGRQNKVTAPETSTDGYNWINANINYRLPFNQTELTLFIKVENLADEAARVHTSFLKDQAPRPGRNIRLGIRGTF